MLIRGIKSFLKLWQHWFIFAVIAASSNLPRASAASLNEAEVAFQKGNYPVALEIWTKMAEEGSASALSGIGILLLTGNGVSKDEPKARDYLRRAAALGDSRGQSALGLALYNGWGGTRDEAEGVKWMHKAAEQGRHQAQHNLAQAYFNGRGVSQDLEQAAYWYQRAAKLGNLESQTQLALLYAAGRGVKQNYPKSFELAEGPANSGNPIAQAHLGDLYRYGTGVPLDYKKAVIWYGKAAQGGNAHAQTSLGIFSEYGYGVDKSNAEALKWYLEAAKKGGVYAINRAGVILMSGTGVPRDQRKAIELFREGAAKDDRFSLALLGYAYEQGRGVEQNTSFANELYKRLEDLTRRSAKYPGTVSNSAYPKSSPATPGGALIGVNPELIYPPHIDSLNQERADYLEFASFLLSSGKYGSLVNAFEYLIALPAGNIPNFENIGVTNDQVRQLLIQYRNDREFRDSYKSSWAPWAQLLDTRLKHYEELNNESTHKILQDFSEAILKTHKPPSILYYLARESKLQYLYVQRLIERNESVKAAILRDLKDIAAEMLQPTAVQAIAHFSHRGVDRSVAYCRAAASRYFHAVSVNGIDDKILRLGSSLDREREFRKPLAHCSFLDWDSFRQIEELFARTVLDAGLREEYFSIKERVRANPDQGDYLSAMLAAKEHSLDLSMLGTQASEAFVEIIRARHSFSYLSKDENGQDGWRSEIDVDTAHRLAAIGDLTGAEHLLHESLTGLDLDDSSSRSIFCRVASALRKIYKQQGNLNGAIPIQKRCIELLLRQEYRYSTGVASALRVFDDRYFLELAEDLTALGRVVESQVVLDIVKEQEHFDFIRRDARADPRRMRLSYTPREEKWMFRYSEIADRLAALGKEEQALAKRAKTGLTDAERIRRVALTTDLEVARTAFQAFLEQTRRELEEMGPARAAEVAESTKDAMAELHWLLKDLGEDVALLRIYLTDGQVNFVLTTPGVQLARSVKLRTNDLNRQVAEFRRLLQDPNSDPVPAAQALYKVLFAPVEKDLMQAGAKTIMLSLDGVLRHLPFGVLHDGERYVVHRWNLPIYTSVVRNRLRESVNAKWRVAGLGVTRRHGDLDPLPAVRSEMGSIVRTGNSGVLPGEVHLDEAFTSDRLRDVSRRSFSVIHVASHFRFSPGTEINSFLLLGDGTRLTLADLRAQNYRFDDVDLLTLSACETGLGGGRDQSGREIEGFGVIAQQQGAKAVLATLWKVADSSTAVLMGDLYSRRVRFGLSKVEALRQAQISLAAHPRTAHPFFWAPFILMGNWK